MLIRNTLWLSLSFLFAKGLTTLWQLYLARFFVATPELYGDYMLLVTQFSIWLAFADGSIVHASQQLLSKSQINEKECSEHLTSAFIFRFILGSIASVGYISMVSIEFPGLTFPAAFLALNIIIFSIGTSSFGIWSLKQNFRIESISGIISTFFFIFSAWIVTLFTESIEIILACFLLSTTISSAYILTKTIQQWSYAPVSLNRLSEIFQQYLPLCLPLTILAFIFLFYFRGDMMFVAARVGSVNVGVYGIALLIFFLVLDITWGQFGKAYAPQLLRHWFDRNDKIDLIKKELHAIFEIYTFIGILVMAGTVILGPVVFSFVFGEKSPWLIVSDPLFWLLTGLMPTIGYSLVSRLILVEGKQSNLVAFSSALIITKITLLLLIPSLTIKEISIFTSLGMTFLFLGASAMLDQLGRSLIFNVSSLVMLFTPSMLTALLVHLHDIHLVSKLQLYVALIIAVVLAGYLSRNGLTQIISTFRNKL